MAEVSFLKCKLFHNLCWVFLYHDVLWMSQQDICMTFIQCWPNVEDVGPTLYKCYTNVLCCMVDGLLYCVTCTTSSVRSKWLRKNISQHSSMLFKKITSVSLSSIDVWERYKCFKSLINETHFHVCAHVLKFYQLNRFDEIYDVKTISNVL